MLNVDSNSTLLSVHLSYFNLYSNYQINFLVYFDLQIIFIILNHYLCIGGFVCLIQIIDSLIFKNLWCLSQILIGDARVHQEMHHCQLEILGFRDLRRWRCRLYYFGKKLHIFQISFSKHYQKSSYFECHYFHLIFAFYLINLYYFFANWSLRSLI